MGLAGVVNLFNGFANIDNYKAAKERKKEALVEREQQTLAVIVQVIRAHEDLQSAQDQSALAAKALEVASRRLAETRSKWEQGLIDASTFLSCQADRDRAQMNAMNARFQHQISIATLLNAMGTIPVESKESSNDKSKS
jgi:outer membrane protein TolC